MRLFEILLLLALLFSFLGVLVKPIRRPTWLILLPWISTVITVLHFLIEGQRWQMTPAYFMTIVLLFITALRLFRNWKQGRKFKEQTAGLLRRVVIVRLGVLSMLIVLATWALAAAVPVPELLEPTGPYAIGTTRFHFVDHGRPEPFTPDTTDHRTLLVQAWYPAEFTKGFQRAPWLPEAEAVFGAGPAYHGFPRFVGGHLALIKSQAYWEAPMSPSQQRYPIVVYSTGIMGFLTSNTTQMQELASHGYIVFSMAHPYQNSFMLYPDGRLLTLDDPITKKQLDALITKQFNLLTANNRFDSLLERQSFYRMMPAFVQRFIRAQIHGRLTEIASQFPDSESPLRLDESAALWANDTRFLVDALEGLNHGEPPSIFANRLDLERMGALGMSFGGASTGLFWASDARCKAGVNLDGIQFGDLGGKLLDKPFMWMHNERRRSMNESIYSGSANPYYRVGINGTTHLDFSDPFATSYLTKLNGFSGPNGGARSMEIINAYVLAFFDRYLKGNEAPLLESASPFAEVDFGKTEMDCLE